MKTAISIPNEIFKKAERVSKKLGIPRSELYSKALKIYLDSLQADEITRTLDEIYGKESSRLDPMIFKIQFSSIPKEDW